MAKYCEACKREYPDDHASCPYCGAGTEPGSNENIDLEQLAAGDDSGPGSKPSMLRRAVQTQLAQAPPDAPPEETTGQPAEAVASAETPPGEDALTGPALAIDEGSDVKMQWSPKVTRIARQAGAEEAGARKTQLAQPEEGSGKKKRTDVIPGGEVVRSGTPTQLAPPGEQAAEAGSEEGDDALAGAEASAASEPISSIPEMDLDELIKTEQMMAENSAVDLGSDPEVEFVDQSSEVNLQPGTRGKQRTTDADEPAELSASDLLEEAVTVPPESGDEGRRGPTSIEALEIFDEPEEIEESTLHQAAAAEAVEEADVADVAEEAPEELDAEALAEDELTPTYHAGSELAEELAARLEEEAPTEVAPGDVAADEFAGELTDEATGEAAEEVGAEDLEDETATAVAEGAVGEDLLEAPPKKKRPALPKIPMPSSTVLTGVASAAGTALLFGLLMVTGVIPVEKGIKGTNTGRSGTPPANFPATNPGPQNPQPAEDALASGETSLKSGEFARAAEQLKKAPESDKRHIALGQALWLSYVQKQRQANTAPRADAPEVKDAVAAFERAKNDPVAQLWLGRIQEQTGNEQAARQTYEQGLQKFGDAKWMFQGALDALEARRPAGAE